MDKALKRFILNQPNQREQLPGQAPNNAGGFSYVTDNWTQLLRFLILGTTDGSYYVGEQDMTRQNLAAVDQCIYEDALRVVNLVKEVSLAGRAPKNDPALFVLAKVASQQTQVNVKGVSITVPTDGARAAYAAIGQVARTFTHLSHFVTFIRKGKMRGWGRGFRKAVANWFNKRPVEQLAYQAIKYRSRDGFSQKDVAWLCHAASFLAKEDVARRAIFNHLDYVTKAGAPPLVLSESDEEKLQQLRAAQALASSVSEVEAVALIRKHRLPMEAVPTTIRSKAVYEAVASDANLGWLLRNLGNLGKVELLSINNANFVRGICASLRDGEGIRKARLHPLNILVALNTYKGGKSIKGSGTWEIVPAVIDALNDAFYASFKYVEPSGKRMLIAIDVSGSMRGTHVHGIENLRAHEAAAVLAMVAAHAESNFHCMAFDTQAYPLSVSARQRVDDVVQTITKTGGGGTDCAIPFHYATMQKLKIDLFVCLTDSETWAGKQHVMPALRDYRKATGIHARAINIAMTANRVSNFNGDPLCLEVSGFDTTIPEVISLFSKDA
jgi:60 kDa SS-A/Ro ribonucleoprotein